VQIQRQSGNLAEISHYVISSAVAVPVSTIWGHGPMVSAVARVYNGDLGAEPRPGQRVTFLKFGNAKK